VRPFLQPPQGQQQRGNELVVPAPPAIMAQNQLPVAPETPPLIASPPTSLAVRPTLSYVHSAVPQKLSITPPTVPAEPAPTATAAASYVPPKPVRRVIARLPVGVVIGNPVEIQVKVEIDAEGRVTKATPLQVNARNFALVDPAVRSAESWHFDPALENGRPVPSDMIVAFRFVPE
jgi:periplasmic protein TonB